MHKNELVIILHGIARTSRSMHKIEKALLSAGYDVMNVDYPSRKEPINVLAEIVYEKIKQSAQKAERTHFVCYSTGCLVLRELLAKHSLNNVGHIVFLGPPNQGSEVADFLQNNFLYRWVYGPAGLELTTKQAKEKPFPLLAYPFGVIAGNCCLDPICHFILPKGNDGKVSIESTKLSGMTDHIVLNASHTFMITNKSVIKQTLHYLAQGSFSR